ncbi:MAG: PaaI family thioesterase [Spirochaetia bacterium]
MKRLNNPYEKIDGYNCFGCARSNDSGLKMEFFLDGEEVVSLWNPEKRFRGYGKVLHGGIIGTLLDELGAWAVMVLAGTAGVTREMTVRYLKPVLTDQGDLTLRSRIVKQEKSAASVRAEIYNPNGILTTEADIQYFLFPRHIAEKRLSYPGTEAFKKNENP